MNIKEIRMLRPILACLALSFAGTGLSAETAEPAAPAAAPEFAQKSGVLLDRVVAVINDGVVTASELDDQIAVNAQRLREQKITPPSALVLRTQSLERLIMQEVQLQKADHISLKVSDEQLNNYLTDSVAKPNGLTLSELPDAMAAQGIDYALFRENKRKEMTLQLLQRREVLSRMNITPREHEQFLERIKRLPDPDTKYDTSHILLALPPDATPAQVGEATRLALEITERAKTEPFSSLAVTYSNSSDALEGGALGERTGPGLPTIFQDVIAGLKPGEISKPLVDANGVHLVRLNNRISSQGDPIEDQVHTRHILMKPNELQDDGTVKLKLAGIRDQVLKGADFGAFAASMSEDPGSAVNGGDLEWKGPGAFVPEFEAVVGALKDNEISEPFQSRYGWHIVQLLGRRKFDITEESLRERAYQQLVESRADEEIEVWLRRLRDEAFVDTLM